jgi:hypothetical protein
MGGSQSSSEITALSQAISNVVENSVQQCVVNATQDQSVAVNNSGWSLGGSYTLEQTSSISSQCFADHQMETQLQNKIIDVISQSATSNSIALIGAFGTSTADAKANLSSIIQNNVTMNNIQTNYNVISQTQKATFNNSGVLLFQTASLTQGSKIFAAATLKTIDNAGVFNTIDKYISQTSTATQTNPLDFIVKAISAVGDTIMSSVFLFIFIIAIVLLGVAWFLGVFSGDSTGADSNDLGQIASTQQTVS